ncbi:MAG: hypothetical protein JSV38_15545, partial [Desulfobacterales bacterium]
MDLMKFYVYILKNVEAFSVVIQDSSLMDNRLRRLSSRNVPTRWAGSETLLWYATGASASIRIRPNGAHTR